MMFRVALLLFFAAFTFAASFEDWWYDPLEEGTTKAIKRGKDRWKQMQDSIKAGGQDVDAMKWCEVEKSWFPRRNDAKNAAGISGRLADFIAGGNLGVDAGGANFEKVITSFPIAKVAPGDDNTAYYENACKSQGYQQLPAMHFRLHTDLLIDNTKDGAIAVVDIARMNGAGKDVTTLTWATWVKVCEDHGASPGSLSQLIHYTCQNAPAKAVSTDLFGENVDEPMSYTVTPGDELVNEPFYALLGLDNGYAFYVPRTVG
jgi:hypothetical protein